MRVGYKISILPLYNATLYIHMKILCTKRRNKVGGLTLPQFAGEDLWVKAYSSESCLYYYIQVLSVDNNMVSYHKIYYRLVEDIDLYVTTTFADKDYFEALDEVWKSPLGTFSIASPIEILTTEDIIKKFKDSKWYVEE